MDTIFPNARVVDGTGAEVCEADVGLIDGVIAAVSCETRSDGGDEIDA
ncbi:MAG: hypothetical protein CFH05_01008 [Alphaproteobacteria bacterium MarineAlpha3_Bin4]|nr:MAG: hypothetical protein CFH05_01008 [Alphaproteobacteria bacterium MarineAlpha3_Bin4]